MKFYVLLLVICLFAQVSLQERVVAHEFSAPVNVPSAWQPLHQNVDQEMLSVVFAMKQSNLNKLEEIFWKVSDPDHPDYTQYLTFEEVQQLVAPPEENVARVLQWIKHQGLSDRISMVSPSKDFIQVEMTTVQAKNMFAIQSDFDMYEHLPTGQMLVRTPGPYHLPESISHIVDFVGGLVRFPDYQHAQTFGTLSVDGPQLQSVTPDKLKTAFNIPQNLVGNNTQNTMSVNQFLGQWYDNQDLAHFQSRFGLPQQIVAKIYGPNNPSQPGVEAQLDIEYITGTAPKIPTWFISFDGFHQNQERFLAWIVNMSATPDAPYVYSVSYGDAESSLSAEYTSRVNTEFQKFGVTGHSILFASGDNGVGCNKDGTQFAPNFPASSPFVTAVGGINLESLPHSFSGWSFSSGGFSNYFSRPQYQDSAVAQYLGQQNANIPPTSFFNKTGRAMPDVAAFSSNVIIIFQGGETPVGGTSCAAPQFSGITALLNDARLNAGKKPLGFLNQWIYKNPDLFQDVTAGRNSYGACQGFPATPGWDPITGFGAANFPKLLSSALAAP